MCGHLAVLSGIVLADAFLLSKTHGQVQSQGGRGLQGHVHQEVGLMAAFM